LGFGYARITHKTDVDVTPDFHAIASLLGDTPNKQEQKSLLDIQMPIDLRGDAHSKFIIDVTITFELFDLPNNFGCHLHVTVLFLELVDIVSLDICICEESGANSLKTGIRYR